MAKEAAAGVASTRVVVGGFSQGGAVSLLMLRSTVKLAAVVGESLIAAGAGAGSRPQRQRASKAPSTHLTCAGLSTYLPLSTAKQFVVPENLATPVLMGHGDADNVVRQRCGGGHHTLCALGGSRSSAPSRCAPLCLQVAYSWGLESRERLESAGVAVDFRTYNGMGHSSCRQELRDLQDFLLKSLPPIESS